MKDVLKRYSHFTENIDGFSREAYIDNLLNLGRNPNNGLPSLNDMFKKADEDYFEGISSNSNILNENSSIIYSIVVSELILSFLHVRIVPIRTPSLIPSFLKSSNTEHILI